MLRLILIHTALPPQQGLKRGVEERREVQTRERAEKKRRERERERGKKRRSGGMG